MPEPGYAGRMLLLSLLACPGPKDDTGSGNTVVPDPPDLVINEFLAQNDTINTDEAGEFDDWLEIYNLSDELVQFTGLYLTDNRAEAPTLWALPDGEGIDAHSYALFWCDGQTDQGAHHTSFKLNKAGDEVNLYYVEGGADPVAVDELDYDPQLPDVSSARVPDGSLNWASGAPTPGASNG